MNHKITEITGKKVTCLVEGKEVEYKGAWPVPWVSSPGENFWKPSGPKGGGEIILVGDVNHPRKMTRTVHEGFHASHRI